MTTGINDKMNVYIDYDKYIIDTKTINVDNYVY